MISWVEWNKLFLSVPEFGSTLMASTDGFNQSDTRRKQPLHSPPEKKKKKKHIIGAQYPIRPNSRFWSEIYFLNMSGGARKQWAISGSNKTPKPKLCLDLKSWPATYMNSLLAFTKAVLHGLKGFPSQYASWWKFLREKGLKPHILSMCSLGCIYRKLCLTDVFLKCSLLPVSHRGSTLIIFYHKILHWRNCIMLQLP